MDQEEILGLLDKIKYAALREQWGIVLTHVNELKEFTLKLSQLQLEKLTWYEMKAKQKDLDENLRDSNKNI